MSADNSQSEIQEYGEILSTPVDGSLPLVVGGQAVNLWAMLHGERFKSELQQRNLLPLTSKDLDLHGSHRLLTELNKRFGGSVVLSRERSPLVGKLQIELGGKLRDIEVLRDVRGMTTHDIENAFVEVKFEGFEIRIPLPATLLKAKLANASQIDQTDRNGVRHVRIMVLVTREYLIGILGAVESGQIKPRVGVNTLEDVLEVVTSQTASICEKTHGIDFNEIWPRAALAAALSHPIVNFVKHRLPVAGQHQV